MKKIPRYLLLFSLAFGLAACATDDSAPSDSETETPDTTEEQAPVNEPEESNNSEDNEEKESDQEPEVVEFDAQIEETIEIEGMEEPILLNLYDNPDAPFLTYVPEDLLVEEASGGEGESYKFHANYEGERLEDINLHVYIFADHITEEPSLEMADSTFAVLLEGMEEASPEDEWYDWSIKEYHSQERSRHAMLGEHSGQYFVMIVNSTPLYSEGFVPRAMKVIEHFYWKDTGEYLVPE